MRFGAGTILNNSVGTNWLERWKWEIVGADWEFGVGAIPDWFGESNGIQKFPIKNKENRLFGRIDIWLTRVGLG